MYLTEEPSLIDHISNASVVIIITVVACATLFMIVMAVLSNVRGFVDELRYLNNEIKRTQGSEQKHYKEQKKRLWLSLLPFHK